MTIASVTASTLRRLRRPVAWGAIAGFQGAWLITRFLSGLKVEDIGLWETFVPALFLLGHLVMAPAPWQWGGRDGLPPSRLRGGLQALVWNGAWVFLLIWGVQDVVRPPRPRPSTQVELDARPPKEETRPPGEDTRPPREDARPPREDGQPPRPNRDERRNPPPPGLPQELKLLSLNLPFALILGWFLAEKERAESSEAELREKERLARALALQAQLHPHALYNSLSGLTELIHEDPEAAEQAVVSMVELLRMLTRQGSMVKLPLAQERALVRRFLALESMRLGDRLAVSWSWPAWADALELPPLLLQPLVENAVKHGISPNPRGGAVHIEAVQDGDRVRLRVVNTGNPWREGAQDGTGLANLRERLALMPGGATLSITRAPDCTLAELSVKARLQP